MATEIRIDAPKKNENYQYDPSLILLRIEVILH